MFYFDSLDAAIEQGWEFRITRACDDVLRCLQNGAIVGKHYKAEAKELIQKMPEEYKAQAAAFSELLEKAQSLPD